MAMSGLARSPQGVTDWSAKMTNGLPVTKAKLAGPQLLLVPQSRASDRI